MTDHARATGVTLQVNVAPVDLPHAKATLRHHLRTWGEQVDEILLTFDLHRSPGRRGEDYDLRRPAMERLLDEISAENARVRVDVVDYGDDAREDVAERFFRSREVPLKDAYGAPFYAYFFGLHRATSRFVLHLDSDLIFGGGSQRWIAEGIELLGRHEDIVFAAPLPGPPTPDGNLPEQVVERHAQTQLFGSKPEFLAIRDRPAYEFRHMTSRLFFVDVPALDADLGPLEPMRPPRGAWYPKHEGHPRFSPAETMLSRAMQQHGKRRVDFAGADPGMWVVHPALRSQDFYDALPSVIERIEAGDVPEGQIGDYELNDSMVDWSTARAGLERPSLVTRIGRRLSHLGR